MENRDALFGLTFEELGPNLFKVKRITDEGKIVEIEMVTVSEEQMQRIRIIRQQLLEQRDQITKESGIRIEKPSKSLTTKIAKLFNRNFNNVNFLAFSK